LLLAWLAFVYPICARAQGVVASQDGILARAEIVESDLVLRWRFLEPLAVPLDSATAEINGRPIGLPQIRPYPQPGDQSLFAFLLDVGDQARSAEISNNNSVLLGLLGKLKPHDHAGIITYNTDAVLLVPQSGNPDDLINSVLDIAPQADKSNRDEALLKAIAMLGELPATRRALFVLTDGHTDSAAQAEDVIQHALQFGITVTFVVANATGARSIDPNSVFAIAIGSGGDVITRADLAKFAEDPFAIIDSGAEVIFPLASSFRLPWETGLNATIRLAYGAKALELKVPVDLPSASPKQMMGYVAGSPVLFGAGMAGFVLFLLLMVLIVRHRRRSANAARLKVISGVRRQAVRVMLQNTEDGSAYPLQAAEIRVGRGGSNDIVLSDETASRLHALLRSSGDGYAIENMSDVNGTVVNGALVDKASLANGDLITLGKTTLRFVVVRN
jgi:hypothetical protein